MRTDNPADADSYRHDGIPWYMLWELADNASGRDDNPEPVA